MSDDFIVTARDCQRIGFCAPGIKRWCDDYNKDFRGFLKNGMSASEALATGDAFAERAVEQARKRIEGDG